MKFAIDGVDEADAAVADAMNAVGDFVADIAGGEDGPMTAAGFGFVEAALDTALVSVQARSYHGIHSKSLSAGGDEAGAFVGRGNSWEDKQQYAKAVADYAEAVCLAPKYGGALNSYAWLLATCPDPKIRDGKKAVELATKLTALDAKNADWLDTFAAAHAEAGDFAEAVRLQERVLMDPQFQKDAAARRRLELYKNKQAYHRE